MILTVSIETTQPIEAINVTNRLTALIGGVEDGLAFFYIPHTTASLLLCEDDDELRADLERTAKLWLAGCRPFAHIRNNNPNSEAHILSAFGGAGVTLAIEAGKLDLGAYQNVLLLEMDGPKRRELRCKVIQG
jgi:secondary thiamine-phosphate synthase enzyme